MKKYEGHEVVDKKDLNRKVMKMKKADLNKSRILGVLTITSGEFTDKEKCAIAKTLSTHIGPGIIAVWREQLSSDLVLIATKSPKK